jgi:hypothetical protein
MSDFERSSTTIEETDKRRPLSRFGDLGDRLTRAFGNPDRSRAELPAWESGEDLEYLSASETVSWQAPDRRFPVVRNGYDCASVDQELAALERELVELRARRSPSAAVAAEIDRIGEQTAAILQTAYEQAAEITRGAREQADKCVADAASNAVAMTEDANRRLSDLDRETDSVWQERARLIDDARGVATALFTLAEEAAERFTPEPAKAGRDGQGAPAPVPAGFGHSPVAEPHESFEPEPQETFRPEPHETFRTEPHTASGAEAQSALDTEPQDS